MLVAAHSSQCNRPMHFDRPALFVSNYFDAWGAHPWSLKWPSLKQLETGRVGKNQPRDAGRHQNQRRDENSLVVLRRKWVLASFPEVRTILGFYHVILLLPCKLNYRALPIRGRELLPSTESDPAGASKTTTGTRLPPYQCVRELRKSTTCVPLEPAFTTHGHVAQENRRTLQSTGLRTLHVE